jgi:pyruvate-formate lyase-activating enzyme
MDATISGKLFERLKEEAIKKGVPVEELMAEMGIKRVDLLPYHKLGIAKYRLLRRPYKLVAEAPSSDFLNDFKNAFVKRGIATTISGISAFTML